MYGAESQLMVLLCRCTPVTTAAAACQAHRTFSRPRAPQAMERVRQAWTRQWARTAST